MKCLALACDYDGTLAHDGVLDDLTANALDRFRASGRRLLMVTGRELPNLQNVCQVLDRFDWIVAENGALLYRPSDHFSQLLCAPPLLSPKSWAKRAPSLFRSAAPLSPHASRMRLS